jgi:hypothetical protein
MFEPREIKAQATVKYIPKDKCRNCKHFQPVTNSVFECALNFPDECCKRG